MSRIRPKFFVNYDRYCLFVSFLAHEYKRLGTDAFIKKFRNQKYRGINQRYLEAYLDYLENKKNNITITCINTRKVLVTDFYVYEFYYKFKDRNVVNEALQDAIPEFLNKGLLITEIQEAVPHAPNNNTIFKEQEHQ